MSVTRIIVGLCLGVLLTSACSDSDNGRGEANAGQGGEAGAAAGAPGRAGEPGAGAANDAGAPGSGGASGGEAAGGAGIAGAAGAPDEPCTYGGITYAAGEAFACDCNTCWCGPGGGVIGTEAGCAACTYLGVPYDVNDSFSSRDGCNTCNCKAYETPVECTKAACTCNADAEWWRDYKAKSPAACQAAKFACPAGTELFNNDCGCGCEQPTHCGKVLDCDPSPNASDGACERWVKQCPYSEVPAN